MLKIKSLFAAVALLLAWSLPASAEIKIITIRGAELIQASPLFKTGQAEIKSEFEKRKSSLEAKIKKLQEDAKKFQREADVMSSEKRASTEKDLSSRKVDLDYEQRKFAEDFKKRDRELSDKLMTNIQQYVVEVAKEKNADLVLQDPVFAAPGIDVTDEVIKRMQAAGK